MFSGMKVANLFLPILALVGCVEVTSVQPAMVGEYAGAVRAAPQRLLCQTPEQIRTAVSILNRDRLEDIWAVPQSVLPKGCKSDILRGGLDARVVGRTSTLNDEWRLDVIEFRIPEPKGSRFQPTVVSYGVDLSTIRFGRGNSRF